MAKLPRLVGVIHLPPLPGSPRAMGKHPAETLQIAGLLAVREAQIYAQAGFDSVIIENFGDTPFYKTHVPPETVASMSVIAAAVRESVNIQVGINVLRNDARSALAIASVTDCDFIRVNVLTGVTATDQGVIEGDAAFLIRERERLQSNVRILADVHVKHGLSLSSRDMAMSVEEVGSRSMTDGVIVTGSGTGKMLEFSLLEAASHAARAHKIPLYVGSGMNRDILREVRHWIDGVIVGSSLRKGDMAGATLEPKKAKEFVRTFNQAKSKPKLKKSKSSGKGASKKK